MKRALLAVVVLVLIAAIAWLISTRGSNDREVATPDTHPTVDAKSAATELATPLGADSATENARTAARVAEIPTPAKPAVTLLRIRTVAKEDGKPLAGVSVTAMPRDDKHWSGFKPIDGSHGNMHESPRTASDGFAEIEVTADIPVHVSANGGSAGVGYAKADVDPIPEGETRSVTLELQSAMDLAFCARAVDAVTHAAVAAARVTIRSGTTSSAAQEKIETDADGRFSVRVQSWNSPSLTLEADSYAIVWIFPVSGHETRETALEIALAKSATLRVHILEASGKPIEGAQLSATVPRYELAQPRDATLSNMSAYQDETFRAKTDATGTAVLANLPPNVRLMLEATRKRDVLRHEQQPLVLKAGEERELTWRIGTGCHVVGTVSEEDGKPANAQEIWLQPARMPGARFLELYEKEGRRTTKCDERGSFEFADVSAGKWQVGPAAVRGQNDPWKDGLVAPWADVVEVLPDVLEVRADIRLFRDLTIRGRVEDPEGHVMDHARVECCRVDTSGMIFANVEEHGTFALGPLVPGSYRVNSDPEGMVPNDADLARSEDVIATSGARDVVLRLRRGCVISGRVVDSVTGEALAAEMVLAPESGQQGVYFTNMMMTSGAHSGFRVEHLPAATYSLSAHTTSGRVGYASKLALAIGEQRTDLEIRVALGATVSVRYGGPNPNGQCEVLSDGVSVGADGIAQGAEHMFTVPAGHSIARMTLYPEKKSFDVELDLTVGARKELVFDGVWK